MACNGCSFYFRSTLIKNCLVKTVFSSYYLKLSLPIFLKFFLILHNFNLMFRVDMLFYNETCMKISSLDYDKNDSHSLPANEQIL